MDDAVDLPQNSTIPHPYGNSDMPHNAFRRLMGAFYTPQSAADFMADWIMRQDEQRVLEPSFGDGIFLRALTMSAMHKDMRNTNIYGIEIDQTVYANALNKQLIDGERAICEDFFRVHPTQFGKFAGVIGNPPYVRIRHISDQAQRSRVLDVAQQVLGQPMDPSGSLWMPFRTCRKTGRREPEIVS